MLTLRFMLLPHLSARRLLNPRNWLGDIKEKGLSASHELWKVGTNSTLLTHAASRLIRPPDLNRSAFSFSVISLSATITTQKFRLFSQHKSLSTRRTRQEASRKKSLREGRRYHMGLRDANQAPHGYQRSRGSYRAARNKTPTGNYDMAKWFLSLLFCFVRTAMSVSMQSAQHFQLAKQRSSRFANMWFTWASMPTNWITAKRCTTIERRSFEDFW